MAAELTASSRDGASTLPDLLAPLEVPIRRFTADGPTATDRSTIGPALSAGLTDGPWAQREASLQRIRKVGRREWQKEPGYRQQARVENSFFRYKSVFGGGPEGTAQQGATQRSRDRVSHPQPDGRAR